MTEKQFESKLNIEVDARTKRATIQLSGDDEFIEKMLPNVKEYLDLVTNSNENNLQAFNEKDGYYSKTLNRKKPTHFDKSSKQKPTSFKPKVEDGIKVGEEDGVKRYRCHYKCPKCKSEGNRYITSEFDTPKVDCHQCGHKMDVFPVTDKNDNYKNIKDDFDNWYVAGDMRPCINGIRQ